jgi:heat shock protein HslJ
MIIISALSILIFSGCSQQDFLSKKSLENLTYHNESVNFGKAALQDGAFTESAAPGSASKNRVKLKGDPVYGEIKGKRAAAVILVTDPPGSGVFYDLAVILEDMKPSDVIPTVNIGDRIVVDSIYFSKDTILVSIWTQAPDEPMVEHSQNEIRRYIMDDNHRLKEVEKEVPDSIADIDWRLIRVAYSNYTEKEIEHPRKYLLHFSGDNRVDVQADCNRGFGSYTMEKDSLKISILATTRAMCPPNSFSEKYVYDLNHVVKYLLKGGKLYLFIEKDLGIMEFEK